MRKHLKEYANHVHLVMIIKTGNDFGKEFASERSEAAYIARTIFFIYSYRLLKKLRLIVVGSCNSSRHERFLREKFFKNEISENNSQKFHDQ